MSVQQPWSIPIKEIEEPKLRVYNSLTKSKVKMFFYPTIGDAYLYVDRIYCSQWTASEVV